MQRVITAFVGGPVDSRSDQQLVSDFADGDASAFDVLYYRYRDWVVSLAFRFTGNQEDALDVLQETFAYVVRKFPKFTLTASMKSFLYPAVRNLSLEVRRKRRQDMRDDFAVEAIPAPDMVQDQRAELFAVMSALPDTHREVLLMRFVDGLSLDEIAQSLQIPLGTVKSRIHNGLEQLRRDPRTLNFFQIQNPSSKIQNSK